MSEYDDKEYDVEEIIGYKKGKGKDYYLVKWEGSDETTWEPEESFNDKQLLLNYKKKLKEEEAIKKKKKKQQEKTKITNKATDKKRQKRSITNKPSQPKKTPDHIEHHVIVCIPGLPEEIYKGFTIHAIRKAENMYQFLVEVEGIDKKIWLGQKDFVEHIPDPSDLITFLLDKFPLFKIENKSVEVSKF